MPQKPVSKSDLHAARERARQARLTQLASQQEKERLLEETATNFFLTQAALEQLMIEQEETERVYAERRAQLEHELGASALTLRTLDTPAMIAQLLGVSNNELSRLIKLTKNTPVDVDAPNTPTLEEEEERTTPPRDLHMLDNAASENTTLTDYTHV